MHTEGVPSALHVEINDRAHLVLSFSSHNPYPRDHESSCCWSNSTSLDVGPVPLLEAVVTPLTITNGQVIGHIPVGARHVQLHLMKISFRLPKGSLQTGPWVATEFVYAPRGLSEELPRPDTLSVIRCGQQTPRTTHDLSQTLSRVSQGVLDVRSR